MPKFHFRQIMSRSNIHERKVISEIQASSNNSHEQSRRRFLSGWRAGAVLSCTTACIVLLINVSFLTWAVHNHVMENAVGALFTGSCAKAKSINTLLGLGINVLCSILLGASNYCMQCLTSPTREEVDKAHARKRLLQIGIPSVRNLRAMSRGRVFLWLGLGLSALPLHFL